MSGFPFLTSLVVAMLLVTLFSLVLNRGLHGKHEAIEGEPRKTKWAKSPSLKRLRFH